MSEVGLFRIGELSRRSGVSPELLRAWERRYGLLQPTRSPGGLASIPPTMSSGWMRCGSISPRGSRRPRRRRSLSASSRTPSRTPRRRRGASQLAAALAAFDEAAAHAVVDMLLARMSLDALLSDVIVPYLHELGDRWERGEVSVAQEHFASSVLRGRLGLARGWGLGSGRGSCSRARRASSTTSA